jgi:hypothetical protein
MSSFEPPCGVGHVAAVQCGRSTEFGLTGLPEVAERRKDAEVVRACPRLGQMPVQDPV